MIIHLPDLKKMLQDKASAPRMQTPFGTLNPPLGSLRLKAVEMVLVLIMVDDTSIRQGKALEPPMQLVAIRLSSLLLKFQCAS